MGGPAWLGIGAQRSGTTWLTELLCEHPQVEVSGGRKEQHELYRALLEPWDESRSREYVRLFDLADPSVRVGEWTPFYMLSPWTPHVAARVLPDEAPIFVILRDPVERFESAVRFWLTRQPGRVGSPQGIEDIRVRSSNALWGGAYATQLDCWATVLGRERIVVLQYETTRADPQGAVDRLWARLELEPVALTRADVRSRSSSNHEVWSLDSVEGLRDQLRRVYRREVECLEDWGIDPQLWPNFAR